MIFVNEQENDENKFMNEWMNATNLPKAMQYKEEI